MNDGETRISAGFRPPGLALDLFELRRAALADRWSLGLMAVGWVHLATFLTCYVMYQAGDLAPPRYLIAWLLEFLVVLGLLRRTVTGNGRHRPPPLSGILARLWITFLILGFSAASLNNLTGMPPEWFKPMWGTLSTFGFADDGLAREPLVPRPGRADVADGDAHGPMDAPRLPLLRALLVAGTPPGRLRPRTAPAQGDRAGEIVVMQRAPRIDRRPGSTPRPGRESS